MTSLFKKQFFFYTSTLIIIFSILGVGIIHAFTSFFLEQKKETLISQGHNIVKAFQDAYHYAGIHNMEKIENEISVLDDYLDSSFIFVDSNRTVTIISGNLNPSLIGASLEGDIVDHTLMGEITSERDIFDDIFTENVMAVGYPVELDDKSGIVGAIFMCSPTTDIDATLAEAYKTIVIFICIAILVGFTVITIFSRSITLPLLKMAEGSKIIAEGNFSHRIKIKSNDEIGQLAESFNKMAESLEKQEMVRTQFISNISHDLRSPLTSIKGFLSAMLDGTIPPENHDKYIKIVYDETERLTKLANSVLEANSPATDEANLVLSDFDINALIKKVSISFSATVSRKHIYLKLAFESPKAYVSADKDKIERVIYNLLDNAIKFTPEKGTIKVLTVDAYDKIKITVSDTGKGISDADQKRIFDRFFKADSSRGLDKMGVGLGLAIVKNFVKAHSSRIEVESRVGKGTSFSFMLSKPQKKMPS